MSNPVVRPVGPEPAGVYWRRRAVLLVVVVALVALVVALPGRGGRADGAAGDPGAAASSASGTEAAAEEPAPAGSTPPSAPTGTAGPDGEEDHAGACSQEQLGVAVAADAGGYDPEVAPRFTVVITNRGDQPCTVDTGSADAVELVVASDGDRVWSSDDCQREGAERLVPLEPGQEERQSVSWQRLRSAPGCAGGLGEASAGTYSVRARVGEFTSRPVEFTLR